MTLHIKERDPFVSEFSVVHDVTLKVQLHEADKVTVLNQVDGRLEEYADLYRCAVARKHGWIDSGLFGEQPAIVITEHFTVPRGI